MAFEVDGIVGRGWNIAEAHFRVWISSPLGPTTVALSIERIDGRGVERAGRCGTSAGMHRNELAMRW